MQKSFLNRAVLMLTILMVSTPFTNLKAQFTVDFSKGCIPLTVTVTDISGADPSNVLYDFGDGLTTETTFTFETEGVKTITQLVGTANGGNSTTLEVEVLNPTEPRFSLTACASKTIQVQVDGGVYDKYRIDYGDGSIEEIFPSDTPLHTYTNGSNATVTVKGLFNNAADNCAEASQTIELLDAIEPATLSNLQVNGGSVQLDFNLPTNTEYILEANTNGSYQEIDRLTAGSSSATVSGQTLPTCYRIRVVDLCTGTEAISNELCSMDITATSADKKNTAAWNQADIDAMPDFGFFEILRDGVSVAGPFPNTFITSYNDEDVECSQEYCYQIRVTSSNGIFTATTDQACVTTVSTTQPLSFNQFYASVEANLGVLRWQVPTGVEATKVIIEKSEGSGTYSNLTEVNGSESSFTDPDIDPTTRYCYRVRLEDDCGNLSDPQISCTVVVSGEKAEQNNQVNWTAFEGFTNFNYFLEVYDDAGNLLREEGPFSPLDNNYLDPSSVLEGNAQTYRIRVVDALSDAESFSNFHRITDPNIIKVPDAFSPNGDGLNDTFDIIGSRISSFRIDIFNRWGTVIFGSDDIGTSWEGTIKNNKPAPKGPYTWVIKAEDDAGVTYDGKGILLLLR